MRKGTLLFIGITFLLTTSCNLFTPQNNEDQHKLGLRFASQDQLNAIPFASTPFSGESLPSVVNLADKLPPVGNQGRQSSCVGWSVGYALKAFEEHVETSQTILFSPSYIYNQLNNGQDGGIKIIDALNLISQQGAGLWADMPYNDKDFTSKPSGTAISNAAKYKIDTWRKVNVLDVKEVKAQVNAGYPVIIGVAMDEAFMSEGGLYKEAYVWKKVTGKFRGGHAMIVVGYDDSKNAFKIMNSWGTEWGDNGYAWIDYSIFPAVVREGFVAKDAANSIPEKPANTKKTVVVEQTEKPTEYLDIKFGNIAVLHNQQDPNGRDGAGMIISGRADIPSGKGKVFQIAIYINDEAGTMAVRSLIPDRYSDPTGNAAIATLIYEIPAAGIFNYRFKVFFPYSALDIQSGHYENGRYQSLTTYMWAKPILFIDNYAVGYGEQQKFFVTR